ATTEQTLKNSAILMQAGANVIKVEGTAWLAESITLLAERGIPVCAHMGLTPQAVNVFGGYKVQGRGETQAQQMVEDARALEAAGAAMLLLECVPSELAARITRAVEDRKSTRLNSSHVKISYAVFCLKKKNTPRNYHYDTDRSIP